MGHRSQLTGHAAGWWHLAGFLFQTLKIPAQAELERGARPSMKNMHASGSSFMAAGSFDCVRLAPHFAQDDIFAGAELSR
jgi:hypothetical protein